MYSSAGDKSTEIRYCHILNKNLPQEIRVLAWAPVDPNFSARFGLNIFLSYIIEWQQSIATHKLKKIVV